MPPSENSSLASPPSSLPQWFHSRAALTIQFPSPITLNCAYLPFLSWCVTPPQTFIFNVSIKVQPRRSSSSLLCRIHGALIFLDPTRLAHSVANDHTHSPAPVVLDNHPSDTSTTPLSRERSKPLTLDPIAWGPAGGLSKPFVNFSPCARNNANLLLGRAAACLSYRFPPIGRRRRRRRRRSPSPRAPIPSLSHDTR